MRLIPITILLLVSSSSWAQLSHIKFQVRVNNVNCNLGDEDSFTAGDSDFQWEFRGTSNGTPAITGSGCREIGGNNNPNSNINQVFINQTNATTATSVAAEWRARENDDGDCADDNDCRISTWIPRTINIRSGTACTWVSNGQSTSSTLCGGSYKLTFAHYWEPVANSPSSITKSPNATVCGGTTVQLTANYTPENTTGVTAETRWYTSSCGTSGHFATGDVINVSPTSTTTYYARRVITSSCGSGNFSVSCASTTVTVVNATGGSVTSSVTCSSRTVSETGGAGSRIWQGSSNGTTFTDISGATGTSYTVPANSPYFWFRTRRFVSPCSDAYSNAVIVISPNYSGTGNIVVSQNITMGGTYTLPGNFTLNSGRTITVPDGCPLEINATNITISGTIDANGAGNAGGTGGAGGTAYVSCSNESNVLYTGGRGLGGAAAPGGGGGGAGSNGTNSNGRSRQCGGLFCSGNSSGYFGGGGGGGGGRGGSYGSNGGTGGYGGGGVWFNNGDNTVYGSGGAGGTAATAQGTSTGTDISMGFGGAGGGGGGGGRFTGTAGGNGGNGGGSVSLIASGTMSVAGTISANGTNGGVGGNGSRGSDNQYDCSIASCGSCGVCSEETFSGSGGAGGGAGGGSGGGIKLQAFGNASITGTLNARGGSGGAAGSPSTSNGTCMSNARGGGGGSGGRIKIFTNPCATNTITPTQSVASGSGGSGNVTGANGSNGTYQGSLTNPNYSVLSAGTITGTQNICYNTNLANINQPASTGGTGTYAYAWYYTTTLSAADPTTQTPVSPWVSAGITTEDLDLPALTGSRKYIRRTISGSCFDWSNAITITVYPDFNPGTVASGNETLCNGGDPSNITLAAAPSGAAGTYTYQWYYSNGSVACPTGTSTTGWTLISGATGSSYNPPSGLTTTRTYALTVNPTGTPDCGGAEWANSCRVVTVQSVPTAGVIAGNQTICFGGDPVAFTSSSNGTGSGTITYRWESSVSPFSTWNTVSGQTASTYNVPSGLNVTTRYRRITISTLNSVVCESVPTSFVEVTVQSVPTAGAIAGAQTICTGGDPVAFTSSSNGTGSGTITYRWESSVSPFSTWNTVSGQTASTYNVPSGLTVTTRYRRITISTLNGTPCESVATTPIEVTVVPDPTLVTQPIGNTICAGQSHSMSVVISNGTGITYQWQYSTDGTNWFNVGVNLPVAGFSYPTGANTASLTINTATSTAPSNLYRYRCVIGVGNGCGPSIFTNVATVNVVPAQITSLHRTWTGMVSNDWLNPLNWDCGGVPDLTTDVRIPQTATTRYPIITNGQVAECNTIDIDENGPPTTIIVDIQDGGTLRVDSP